jgi:hypothetical protein
LTGTQTLALARERRPALTRTPRLATTDQAGERQREIL